MGEVVVRGIDTLCTFAEGDGELGVQRDAAVHIVDGVFQWVGRSADAPDCEHTVDGAGCIGFPALVDMHTHSVWAGSRAVEFERRLAGESYTKILQEGGGILSTVAATRRASLDELTTLCARRLRRMASRGVGTVEIKSGYGLSAIEELKLLQAARAAGEQAGVHVLTTFLGAHAVPIEWRPDQAGYVEDVIHNQLPTVAPFADFVDVYVDRGAFTVEEGRSILRAGQALGLGVRVHAEQVARTGAAAMAAQLSALSADHLERVDADGIDAMATAGTVAGLLPGAMLYLRDTPPPVEQLREAGVRFALGTDYNPGSSPVDDLWTVATLAAIRMGLTVDEALVGITRNAADSLAQPQKGRVACGCDAPLLLIRPPPGEPCEPPVLIQHLGTPNIVASVGAEPQV